MYIKASFLTFSMDSWCESCIPTTHSTHTSTLPAVSFIQLQTKSFRDLKMGQGRENYSTLAWTMIYSCKFGINPNTDSSDTVYRR